MKQHYFAQFFRPEKSMTDAASERKMFFIPNGKERGRLVWGSNTKGTSHMVKA